MYFKNNSVQSYEYSLKINTIKIVKDPTNDYSGLFYICLKLLLLGVMVTEYDSTSFMFYKQYHKQGKTEHVIVNVTLP